MESKKRYQEQRIQQKNLNALPDLNEDSIRERNLFT